MNPNINPSLHLKRPTDDLVIFMTMAQTIIRKTIEKMPLKRNIHKFLHKKIISILYSVFIINDSCKHYLDFLITHLVHCKLLKDFN